MSHINVWLKYWLFWMLFRTLTTPMPIFCLLYPSVTDNQINLDTPGTQMLWPFFILTNFNGYWHSLFCPGPLIYSKIDKKCSLYTQWLEYTFSFMILCLNLLKFIWIFFFIVTVIKLCWYHNKKKAIFEKKTLFRIILCF